MVIVLIALVIALSVVIAIQYRAYQTRSSTLQHMHHRLNEIITGSTQEKLLAFTSDTELILILKDINHLLEHHQQETADFARMEQSMRKMIANVSHDLKTPLTVVLGYLEAMHLDPEIGEEERSVLLSKVYAKAQEVLELIRHFFDLARIESGDQEVPLSLVHMNEICERNILNFYDTLTSKGFDVSIEIPPKPLYAWGNEAALDRILTNLIANAIQHGAEGMAVGLTLRDAGEFLSVEVWDKGKGIAELHQDRVFERMYTLEDSRNKSYQGSGLGLTITKRLVEAQGGTISIDSKPYEKTVVASVLKLMRLELRKFDIKPYTRASIIGTILIFILISGMSLNAQMRESLPLSNYDEMFSIIDTLVRGMYIVLAAVMISRLIIDEFRSKTITLMFTYPVNRRMVMAAKLLVIVLFMFIANIASCLLIGAGFVTLNHVEGAIPELLTWSVTKRFLLLVLMNALATSFLSLIPLFFGMRKHSVATAITSSIFVAALVCQNIDGVTLYSIVAIPIALAILGATIGYMSIRNVERVDVLK